MTKFLPTLLSLSFLIVALPAGAAPAAENDQPWEKLQKDGTEDIDTGRYGDAERVLRLAVIKGGNFGEKDLRFAKSLGELGRLYTIRGRFAEAEPLLEEELYVKEQAMNAETGEIIPSMGSLVSFYLEHGTASKAEPLAEKLLGFVTGKMDEAASGAKSNAKYQKGVPLTGWAGQASLTMRDPAIEWAITCDAIGNQFRLRNNLDMAEKLFKAALDVKETILGKFHLSLANSYDNLGTICMERNQDAEAETFFRYALETTERIEPPENPTVFSRLDKLA
ncbi:MAG TPA: tetratricopeptide repeat protein, partial [Chroococcales cyanobacterium]